MPPPSSSSATSTTSKPTINTPSIRKKRRIDSAAEQGKLSSLQSNNPTTAQQQPVEQQESSNAVDVNNITNTKNLRFRHQHEHTDTILSSSKINSSRQTLLNWLKLFRAECQCLHTLLRGGLRDNALHNTIFHKQGMICCRLLGLWYRNYKKEVCFHFIQQVELFRKKRRQRKSVSRWARRKKMNEEDDHVEDDNATAAVRISKRQQKINAYLEKKRQNKVKSKKGKSLRSKSKVQKTLAVFIATTREYRLRRRILLELMKAGWSCAAELQIMRANTATTAAGLMASLARMHYLMSSRCENSDSDASPKTDQDKENPKSDGLSRNGGAFGSWLLC